MAFPHRPSRSSLLPGCILALFACMTTGSALAASPAPGDIARLLACRKVAAPDARLRCFDRTAALIAHPANAAGPAVASAAMSAVAPSPGPSTTRTARTAALNPQQTFGLSSQAILAREVTAGIRPKGIASISARITGLRAAPDGRMIYSLDDGQTWEELQDNGYAPPVKAGDRVRITRGWLQSYWMQTASGRGCKVERLR